MGLNNTNGNMYPWVTHTWNPLAGECQHNCSYCYMKKSFLGNLKKYEGKARISEEELQIDLGTKKTIFVGSATDIFGKWVPNNMIETILQYCQKYPNIYLFQSKNPGRFAEVLDLLPDKSILATTLETNRDYSVSQAPIPSQRYQDFLDINYPRKMISIEPIIDFDLDILLTWIKNIKPEFVSIGADSKKNDLKEPSSHKIEVLIAEIKKCSEIRVKKNLKRVIEMIV